MLEKVLLNLLGINRLHKLELYLEKQNQNIDYFILKSIILYLFIIIIIFVLYATNTINLVTSIILLLTSYPIIFTFSYIIVYYNETILQNQITNYLPDFISQAGLFPKNTNIIKIMEYTSKQDFGPLSKEIDIALDQINKGFKVETSLKEIINRNENKLLEKVINILIVGYNSGADLSNMFRKLTQDINKFKEIETEKESSLKIHKYTLIISATILVPLIMSWILNILTEMQFNSNLLINNQKDILEFSRILITIYLFEFSILVSIFIAIIENNWKKSVLYALIITPIAFTIFIIGL